MTIQLTSKEHYRHLRNIPCNVETRDANSTFRAITSKARERCDINVSQTGWVGGVEHRRTLANRGNDTLDPTRQRLFATWATISFSQRFLLQVNNYTRLLFLFHLPLFSGVFHFESIPVSAFHNIQPTRVW